MINKPPPLSRENYNRDLGPQKKGVHYLGVYIRVWGLGLSLGPRGQDLGLSHGFASAGVH